MISTYQSPIQETHYDILSVNEDATLEQIRASYKATILHCHPDKLQGKPNIHSQSQERFLKVQKAWEVLSNSNSRAAYNRELMASKQEWEFAESIKLDEMMVEDSGETCELFYQCRCGDYFSISSTEFEEMGFAWKKRNQFEILRKERIPLSVLLPCGSCSEKVRLILNESLHETVPV